MLSKFLINIFLVLTMVENLLACDCWPVASAHEALKSSTLVFEGEVVQLQRFGLDTLKAEYKEFAVKLRKIKVWKGSSDDYYIVRTPAEKSDCGFEFKMGESYVVYAVGSPIPLVTKCSRTAPSNSQGAKSDTIQLGPPKN
jgi:hypothetical protein